MLTSTAFNHLKNIEELYIGATLHPTFVNGLYFYLFGVPEDGMVLWWMMVTPRASKRVGVVN